MFSQWGQFLAHDTDFSSPLPRFEFQTERSDVWIPITVPKVKMPVIPMFNTVVAIDYFNGNMSRVMCTLILIRRVTNICHLFDQPIIGISNIIIYGTSLFVSLIVNPVCLSV